MTPEEMEDMARMITLRMVNVQTIEPNAGLIFDCRNCWSSGGVPIYDIVHLTILVMNALAGLR